MHTDCDSIYDANCIYCRKDEELIRAMHEVLELPASTVYLWRDDRYPGRCVVALNRHCCELFLLEPTVRQQFMEEVALVAAAIQQCFQADKINYAVFGDAVPHLHFHLVPKRKDGPEWGQQFIVNPSGQPSLSAENTHGFVDLLRKRLTALSR